jgi:hypothetical protein
MFKSKWLFTKLVMAVALLGVVALPAQSAGAATSTAPTLGLKVLLIGGSPTSGNAEPTTTAWEDALTSEGVPFTEVDGAGLYGAETVTLPTLTSSASVRQLQRQWSSLIPTHRFATGQLTALYTYEASFRNSPDRRKRLPRYN